MIKTQQHIPEELKKIDHWMLYKEEEVEGKNRKTKKPYMAVENRYGSSTDSTRWCSYDTAVQALTDKPNMDGLAFALSDSPYCGIDLDDCIEGGEIEPWAQAVISTMASYTELSPSGTGVHILIKGVKPGALCKETSPDKKSAIEMYGEGRFFTVTGGHILDTPMTCEARQEELTELYNQTFAAKIARAAEPMPEPGSGGFIGTKEEILEKARTSKNGDAFIRLYDKGDITGYASASEADMALIFRLIFWCGPKYELIDELLRESALVRPKWDRADYIRKSIENGLKEAKEYYAMPGDAASDFKDKDVSVDDMKASHDWPVPLKDFKLGKAPKRKWLLSEWLPQGEISSMYGGGSSGKSLLSLQMGIAVSSGVDFLGVKVERPMPFIGIYCEDSYNEIWRRLDDIRAASEYAFLEDPDFVVWPRVGKDNALAVATGSDVIKGPFMDKLRTYLDTLEKGPRFMVLDTLSDIYMGDENTREKVNKVIKVHLSSLAQDYDLTVLMLAHPSRTGQNTEDMLSGSTAWENAVRNRLVLKSDKKVKDVVTLIRYKSNYAAKDDVGISIQWERGRFIPLAYGSATDEQRRKAKSLCEFVHKVYAKKRPEGEVAINRAFLDNLLSEGVAYSYILDSSTNDRIQQTKLITLAKIGMPIIGNVEFNYEFRETRPSHWITWKQEADLFS
jgi:hypothetical protein